MLENNLLVAQWPELLSPSQFFSDRLPEKDASKELLLQWAVFMDGLKQYYALAENDSGRASEEFREEEIWLLADDHEWPFSFTNLCETFGFQTASLRAALVAWKDAHLSTASSDERKKKSLRGFPHV